MWILKKKKKKVCCDPVNTGWLEEIATANNPAFWKET